MEWRPQRYNGSEGLQNSTVTLTSARPHGQPCSFFQHLLCPQTEATIGTDGDNAAVRNNDLGNYYLRIAGGLYVARRHYRIARERS